MMVVLDLCWKEIRWRAERKFHGEAVLMHVYVRGWDESLLDLAKSSRWCYENYVGRAAYYTA